MPAVGLMSTLGALGWAAFNGGFLREGKELLAMPWGVLSLVEAYVGILLFGGWVWVREGNRLTAYTWLVAIVLAGNAISCMYVLVALWESQGSPGRFWLGKRTCPR